MPVRPSDLPGWVASVFGTSDPGATRKTAGWEPGRAPAAQEVNWFWKNLSDWIAHLAGVSASFPTVEDFIDNVAAGATGQVWEDDLGELPGSEVATATPIAAGDCMASTGRDLIIGGGDVDPVRVGREALGTVKTTYVRTNSGTLNAIATDGVYVVVAYGDRYVELFTLAGASEWVYDYGASNTVNDVCLDSERVYLVGDLTSNQARAIGISDGVADWSYDHGAELFSCCTDGVRLYAAGTANGSSQSLVGLVATTGAATGIGWTAATGTAIAKKSLLATDGRILWAAYGSSTYTVAALGCADGQVGHSQALTGAGDPGALAADGQRVYVTDASSGVRAFERDSLAAAWYHDLGAAGFQVASDGGAVFVGLTSGATLRRLARHNRPAVFRRVDPSSDLYGHRRLAAIV